MSEMKVRKLYKDEPMDADLVFRLMGAEERLRGVRMSAEYHEVRADMLEQEGRHDEASSQWAVALMMRVVEEHKKRVRL